MILPSSNLPLRAFALVCSAPFLLQSVSPAAGKLPETEEGQSVAEFDDSDSPDFGWQVVDDGVMGGLSKGRAELTTEGTLQFSGDLSLENNGGFSSVRSKDIALDLANDEGFLLRVKGDGRTYQVRGATDARYRGMEVSFSGEFETKAGEWVEVLVPFSSMKGSFRGMSLDREKFDPAQVQRLGFILSDKKAGPFALEVDWIRTYSDGQGSSTPDEGTAGQGDAAISSGLVGLLAEDPRFQTLVSALTNADLLSVFGQGNNYTVFAPSDEAFAKLPKETIGDLLKPENQEELRRILSYHVLSGTENLASLLKSGQAASLEGSEIEVKFSEGQIRINDAALLDANLEAADGIVHVIDTVLIPTRSAPQTLLTTAESAGSFSTLLAAINAAGLDEVLGGEGPFTVFAPTDEAFSAIPDERIAELLKEENRDELVSLLTTHVVEGRIRAGDALNAGTAQSLSGTGLTFAVEEGSLKVNGATITTTDLDGGNGIIHVIDAVLTPASSVREQAADPAECAPHQNDFRVRATEEIATAIEMGVPLYNSGDAEACADVYEECILYIAELSQLDDRTRQMLAEVVRRGKSHLDPDNRAWLYRRTLDSMMHILQRAD